MKRALFLILLFLIIGNIKAQETPTAHSIFQRAKQEAVRSHRKIFILFQASWCVWCHVMDSSMADASCREFFRNNYVVVHLTIQETEKNKDRENPGGMAMYTKYGGDDNEGIPYWLVFDEEGSLLADSQMRPGENAGCPATKQEVNYFLDVLKKTSSLTPEQSKIIETRFRKNDH
ncbi:MAG: thioredoxin family protein [Flavisolibacter sp.]